MPPLLWHARDCSLLPIAIYTRKERAPPAAPPRPLIGRPRSLFSWAKWRGCLSRRPWELGLD
jgi:hypothetical protein